jgi:hypothetical protein
MTAFARSMLVCDPSDVVFVSEFFGPVGTDLKILEPSRASLVLMDVEAFSAENEVLAVCVGL